MAVESVVIRGGLPASGSKDFTSAGFGTLDAAIVLTVGGDQTTPQAPGGQISIGFYDGTNQSCHAVCNEDNVGTANSARAQSTSHIARVMDHNNTDVATYTASTITDGIRITIDTDNTTKSFHIVVLLLKGLKNASAIWTNSTTVTTGFRPSLILAAHSSIGNNVNHVGRGELTFGVAHIDSVGTITQHYAGLADHDGQTTIKGAQGLFTGAIGAEFQAWKVNYDVTINTVTSTNFTTSTDPVGSDRTSFLAIELDNHDDAAIGTFTSPTTNGTKTVTGLNWAPATLAVAGVAVTALNTHTTTDDTAFHAGFTDGVTTSGIWYAAEDGASLSNTEASRSWSSLVHWRDAQATGRREEYANFESFNSDGFSLDYTNTESGEYANWFLAFKGATTVSEANLAATESGSDTFVGTGDAVAVMTLAGAESGADTFYGTDASFTPQVPYDGAIPVDGTTMKVAGGATVTVQYIKSFTRELTEAEFNAE